MRLRSIGILVMALALPAACLGQLPPASTPHAVPSIPLAPGSGPPSASSVGTLPSLPPMAILAAGDIADCTASGDEATAALLDGIDGTILALGDLAYERGTRKEFEYCYGPTWGRHRNRTIPTPGNHEYETHGAAPYFDYFGPVAGVPGQGWNAFKVGSWRIIVLNSNCDEVGGCGPGSPQAHWLADSLATDSPDPVTCTLAIWHHPRWSSGAEHGSDQRTAELWRLLSNAGADLVLSGHDHGYERFRPMDSDGRADPGGMVQFVVGTGGRYLHPFGDILATSAAHDGSTHGVLKLAVHDRSYEWEFLPTTEGSFSDSGSARCR